MLNDLSRLLRVGESLRFTVSAVDGGLKIAVQPVLAADTQSGSGAAPATEHEKALLRVRAALSMPLVATLTGDNPDAEMAQLCAGFGEARDEARSGLEALMASIKDAGKSAENTASKAKGAGGKAPAGATATTTPAPKGATTPPVQAAAPAEPPSPDNLFAD